MARVTPTDWQQLDCLHEQEKATIEWLADTLPDDYALFAGLGWAASHNGGGSYFGEIDIAILGPAGKLLLIEQKNGILSVENGDLVKHYGSQRKSVLSQIRRSIDAVKRQWSNQKHSQPLPVEYLLYLPDYHVDDVSAIAVQAERIIDRDRARDLPDIIRTLLDEAANSALHEQVLNFLHGTAAIIQDADIASLRVDQRYQTEGQVLSNTLCRLQLSPWRMTVRGRAGSGKTLIGQRLFRDSQTRGERALYLCFNRPLADGLARTLRSATSVMTIDRLTERLPLPIGDFDPAQGSDAFEQRRNTFMATPATTDQQYDLIVVDEGQDFSASQARLVEHLLKPQGKLLWLEDANQNLFRKPTCTPETSAQLELPENYRSTREIVQAMNTILKLDPGDIPASPIAGESPALFCAEPGDQMESVQQAINQFLNQGHALSDITVLSYHGYASSALLQQERIGPWRTRHFTSSYDPDGNQQYSEGELRLESVHRFKGLQSPAVVLAEIDFTELNDDARRRLYVGMTRAKLALALVLTKSAMETLKSSLIGVGKS